MILIPKLILLRNKLLNNELQLNKHPYTERLSLFLVLSVECMKLVERSTLMHQTCHGDITLKLYKMKLSIEAMESMNLESMHIIAEIIDHYQKEVIANED